MIRLAYRNIIFLVLLLVVTSLSVKAQQVSLSSAKSVAVSVLNRSVGSSQNHAKAKASSSSNLTLAYTAKDGDKVLYYVFNDVKNNCFVIIGGDQTAEQVLGYCNGSIYDAATAPEALKWLLSQYAEQIIEGMNVTSGMMRKAGNKQDVEPLITSTWAQSYPYNAAIPLASGDKRYLTGCVATAMAQVMRYNRCPKGKGSSRTSYNQNGTTFNADFGSTTYDWDNMLDSYSGTYSDAQRDAMATLVYHAGVAVKMQYGISGSGAFPTMIPSKLVSNFGYDNSVSYISHTYFSDNAWEDILYSELQQNRPIIYKGENKNNASDQHCFICDGYRASDNLFHINWGWAGNYNGYYALDGSAVLTGKTFNYAKNHGAVIDIKPGVSKADMTDDDEEVYVVPRVMCSAQLFVKETGKINKKYSIYSLEKDQTELPTMEFKLSLWNARVKSEDLLPGVMFVDTVNVDTLYVPYDQTVTLGAGQSNSLRLSLDFSSLMSKDAVYRLYPVIRSNGSTSNSDWIVPLLKYGADIPIVTIGHPIDNKEEEEGKTDTEDQTTQTDTIRVSADRELGQGNIVTKIPYDESAVCQLLGIDLISPDIIYDVKPTTGELIREWAQYDGWVNADGNPTTYSDDGDAIMSVKYPHDGVMYLSTNPRTEPTVPGTYKTQWAVVKDKKKVIIDVTVNFVQPRDTPEPTEGISYTKYIVNPDFTGNDVETGWTEGDSWGAWNPDENAEMYRPYYNTYQTIKGLPKGKYLVEVDAFYRDGLPENEEKTYFHSDSQAESARLFIECSKGFFEVPICRAASAASKVKLADNESALTNSEGETVYIPNDMKSAAVYFNKGLYKNGIWAEVGNDGQLKIGMRYEATGGCDFDWWADGRWTIVDNWKLTYFPNDSAHVCGDNQYAKTAGIDFKQYIANQPTATDDNPVDCTSFLVNPTYDHGDVTTGWLGGPNFTPFPSSEIASIPRGHYTTQDNFQHISGLPAGVYRIDVDGFYSYGDHIWEYYGSLNNWYNNEISGAVAASNASLGRLYSVTSKGKVDVPLQRMFWGRSAQSLGGQEITDDSLLVMLHENPWLTALQDDRPGTDYFPDDAKSASIYMEQGRYPNSMYVEVGDDGELLLGVNDSTGFSVEWLVVDNWKLYYCGTTSKHSHGEDGCAFQKTFIDYDSYAEYMKTVDAAVAEIDKNNGKQTDVSSVIRNADFDDNTAWFDSPTINFSCGEKFYCKFDVNQSVITPKAGYYKLACQGFYRYNNTEVNTNSVAVTTHNNGKEKLYAKLYVDDAQTPLMSIAEEKDDIAAMGLAATESDLPYSMEEAHQAFEAGLYDNNSILFHAEAGQKVKIGVLKKFTLGADWTIFDNFRLTYCGVNDPTKLYGDVNGDGSVDISDVNAIISVICGNSLSPEGERAGEIGSSDVNGDGIVDISDVNAVIAVICGQ